jgi:hypothetical protein
MVGPSLQNTPFEKKKQKTLQTLQLKMSKPTEVVKTTSAGATIQNVWICEDSM